MQDPRKYFGNDTASIEQALGRMVQESYGEANCHQDKCYQLVREKMEMDRRFDHFAKDRLLDKLREAGKSGAKIDWDDDYLYGGEDRYRPQGNLSRS